jgi:hypothetical protein
MEKLYLFCLGLGGVLLVTSLFADAEGPDDFGDVGWQQLFSLRNVTYFLFVLGAAGWLLSWLRGGSGSLGTFVMAFGAASAMATLVHYVFQYIHRTDSSEVQSDNALVGRSARVMVPVGSAGVGKIELSFGGQRVELLARPFGQDASTALEIGNGSEVVIVEMVAGTALVSRANTE